MLNHLYSENSLPGVERDSLTAEMNDPRYLDHGD